MSCINGANGDSYSRKTMDELNNAGFRTVLCHWRHAYFGKEGQPKPKNFQTFTNVDDETAFVDHVHKKYPEADIYLIGLSMGGNCWIRWAGKNKVD